MNWPGHQALAIVSIPLFITKIEINTNIDFIDTLIDNRNTFTNLFNISIINQTWYMILIVTFLYFLGAKFPDFDFMLKSFFKRNERFRYHRQITHSLTLTLILLIYSIYSFNIYLMAFSYGLLTHLIGDLLTGTIPIFLYGTYYKSGIGSSRIGIDNICFFIHKSLREKIKKNIVKFFDKLFKKHFYILFLLLVLYFSFYYNIIKFSI